MPAPEDQQEQVVTRWASDVLRVYVAGGAALLLALVLQLLAGGLTALPLSTYRWVVCYALGMLTFSTLTVIAFSRDTAGSSRLNIAGRDAAPTGWDVLPAVLVTVVALAVALWYVPYGRGLPTPAQQLLTGACAVVLVVAAWATMTVCFAAVYARAERHRGGFVFAGDRAPHLSDHLYLAAAVSTTLGTTDVTVTTRENRRAVLVHSVLAFAFNTVVLALLVTSLST